MPLVANWIWNAGDPAPRNTHMQFRREFTLSELPAAASLHISADSRYILYVNGARLGYGPARNYHYHYEYDTYDLADQLVAGVNVIAVHVVALGREQLLPDGRPRRPAGAARPRRPARPCSPTPPGRRRPAPPTG